MDKIHQAMSTVNLVTPILYLETKNEFTLSEAARAQLYSRFEDLMRDELIHIDLAIRLEREAKMRLRGV